MYLCICVFATTAPRLCKKKKKPKEKQRKAFPFGSKTTATTEKRFSLNSFVVVFVVVV